MRRLRYGIIVLLLLTCVAASASARVNIGIGIGLPNVNIGINLPLLPELVPVPGYPVYYAPQVEANYFFYDGLYWVYRNDNWYASYWYNGPWWFVEPTIVPVYILRIPVRYYTQPPVYFRDWRPDAPPRWGQHWGRDWERHRKGWDMWKHNASPVRAPLPAYQRQYTGERYPRFEQQQDLRREHYRYQPRDRVVRQHFQQPGESGAIAPPRQEQRHDEHRMKGPAQKDIQQPAVVPHSQQPYRNAPQPTFQQQRPQPGGIQQERQPSHSHGQEQQFQERGERSPESRGQGHEQRRDEGRGREHDN